MSIKREDIKVGAKYRNKFFPDQYFIITKFLHHTHFEYMYFMLNRPGHTNTSTFDYFIGVSDNWEPVYTIEGFEV